MPREEIFLLSWNRIQTFTFWTQVSLFYQQKWASFMCLRTQPKGAQVTGALLVCPSTVTSVSVQVNPPFTEWDVEIFRVYTPFPLADDVRLCLAVLPWTRRPYQSHSKTAPPCSQRPCPLPVWLLAAFRWPPSTPNDTTSHLGIQSAANWANNQTPLWWYAAPCVCGGPSHVQAVPLMSNSLRLKALCGSKFGVVFVIGSASTLGELRQCPRDLSFCEDCT